MAEPSLRELQALDRQRRMENHRGDLERRAKQYGLPIGSDVWDLARRVHEYEDELRRPELEARARRLKVATHQGWGPFKVKRGITDLSLACYAEEDRRRLMRELGINSTRRTS